MTPIKMSFFAQDEHRISRLLCFLFFLKIAKIFIVMTASDEFYSTCGFSFCSGSYSSQTAFVSQILFENKLII